MRYLFLTLLFILWSSNVTGRELTLKQALELAEVYSFRQKQARATTAAAEKSLSAVRAERLPTLSASAYATWIDEVSSLDVEIPFGQSFSCDVGSRDKYQVDVSMSVPLFTGGRISSSIDLAEANRDYQQANEQMELEQLQYLVRVNYLSLHRANRLYKAARASHSRTVIIRADVNSRYTAGVADSIDLLDADLAYTQATFAIRQAKTNIRIHEVRLAACLGHSLSERYELTDSLNAPGEFLITDNETSIRPAVSAAQAGIALNESRLGLKRAAWYPTLSAFTSYSYGKPNIDLFNDTWNDAITVGARLNWSFNLGNRTSAEHQAAMLELTASKHHHDDVISRLDESARLAFENLKLAHEQYLSARDEFQLATQNYRLAQTMHREGALSANRLLEIEAMLTQAESSMEATKVDYYIAQSTYYLAVGSKKLSEEI